MDLDLAQLRALDAAVTEGTMDAAARALHITPSAVSQRLRALEASLGRVLLVRSKPVTVTDAGAAVLRIARQIDALASELSAEVAGDTGDDVPARRSIPLAVNADSLATWVLPALASVDGIDFEFHREDQEHTTSYLRDGTVMAAITSESTPVQGCAVEPLCVARYVPCAADTYVVTWFPNGVSRRALAAAPVVEFDRKDELQRRYLARRGVPDATPPRHQVPASADFVAAVRLGYGWGMVPTWQLPDAGPKVVVLDERGIDVPLYWQQWNLRSAALDRVREAIMAAATSLRDG
ncbi:LysR family transcriptional regulator ArgP [Humibacter ginsenosidimutans]|uniref:LysR family transcriptional regulator ArgP n=1 Tax=Humibacter ginsenosidimutans TaxID=2599293 RepID=A0A5B8M1S4_9MICO|nr:LysR family transcriptional regulator ArgP [Humibacter ginsenosidimutans]QDZ14607.1 LysR family transcriptional regulator ArgP [Humibacter ginsenosidimutans]